MNQSNYSEEVNEELEFFKFNFIDRKFGEPTNQRFPTREEVERYRGKLPDVLLAIWETVGFSGYCDGGLWLVNPADYEAIVDRILAPTLFIEQDTYHVIARNAWGDLKLWGEKTGYSLGINSKMQWITTKIPDTDKIAAGKANETITWALCITQKSFLEEEDEEEQPMLARAIAKLGKLNEGEMYGFAPFLFLGGKCRLENLHKVDIRIHLNLIADMGEFEVIDFASLTKRAIENYQEGRGDQS